MTKFGQISAFLAEDALLGLRLGGNLTPKIFTLKFKTFDSLKVGRGAFWRLFARHRANEPDKIN
ncbi:MAG: hypothetical protein LBS60_06065 [Deltaproteobacteria bacterium]|nr:hypothetical protein [Deltaproteobacteria bacterium]